LSKKSNNQGRGYEYVWIKILEENLKKFIPVKIFQNSSLDANKNAYETLTEEQKKIYKISAESAIETIFELEPRIFENLSEELILKFQKDEVAIKGDVRDIVISRKNFEIGLSIKHNHDAIKHSRLSKKIDFGAEWFEKPCSENYWQKILPIFDRLKILQEKNLKWSEVADKNNSVYVPLLQAFIDEIKNSYANDKNIPRKIVEYLIGVKDYYKIISRDNKKITIIETFNLHGTLNKPSKKIISAITVPKISLPTELVAIKFKNNSKNTVEMYLNNGWQINFRIHNASTKVEPSLKFDIKFIGIPPEVLILKCVW